MNADDLVEPVELLGPWQDHAACRGFDTGAFFAGDNGSGGDGVGVLARARTNAAKAICACCLVRSQCRDAGRYEDYGIWGGTTPAERQRHRRNAS